MPRVLLESLCEFSGLYRAEAIQKPAVLRVVTTPFSKSRCEDEPKKVIG